MSGSRTLVVIALSLTFAAACGGDDDQPRVSNSTTTAPAITTASASAAGSSDATPAVVAAANAFLATLSAAERNDVRFEWSDTAQKQRWSNFPEGLFTRDGLMWGNLSAAQQNAWLAIMKATLSTEGYDRVIKEMNADEALAGESGGGGGPGGGQKLGKQYYWVALIGEPSTTAPWQWQWGGHHVTVNATISGSKLALTPSFIGVQPADYTDSGTTITPLGDIADEAYKLLGSLDDGQRSAAVLGDSVIDLVLGPGEDGKTIQAEGLAGAKLTSAQKAMFTTLIGEYGNLANAEDATSRMAELTAGLDQTYFAWYGPTTASGGGYFRVVGPKIVIEYSPQSMGGNAADHVHGIYRDPTNDYGAAITG